MPDGTAGYGDNPDRDGSALSGDYTAATDSDFFAKLFGSGRLITDPDLGYGPHTDQGPPGTGAGAVNLLTASQSLSLRQRARVLTALAGFELSDRTWAELGPSVVALAPTDPGLAGTREFAEAAHALPISEVAREQLTALVGPGSLARHVEPPPRRPAAPNSLILGTNDPEELKRQAHKYNSLVTPYWTDDDNPPSFAALADVDLITAGQIVTRLFDVVLVDNADQRAGNRLMSVVAALPAGYPLAVEHLVDVWLNTSFGLPEIQFAFVLGRADVDDVLNGFAALLDDRGRPRDRLLDLLSAVADEVDQPTGHLMNVRGVFGGGGTGSHVVNWSYFSRFDRDEVLIDTEDHGPRPSGEKSGDTLDEGASQRRLLADVVLPSDSAQSQPLTAGFVRGRRHQVAIRIGHRRDGKPTTIPGSQPFEESTVQPEEGKVTELQVIVTHRGQDAQTEKLYLPNDVAVSSEACKFELFVGAEEYNVVAAVIVKQGIRMLAQAQLIGAAAASIDGLSDDGRIELIDEVVARPWENPVSPTEFDVCVANPSRESPVMVTADSPGHTVPSWTAGIRTTVLELATVLYDTARLALDLGDEEAWPALVRKLAAQGAVLYDWLNEHDYDEMAAAQRIQLLNADPGDPLPIEWVYQGAAVTPESVPCPNWSTAIDTGRCDVCDDDPDGYVCPLGFWGLTKVIERRTGRAAAALGRVVSLGGALFAASQNVLDDNYGETVDVLAATLGAPPRTPETWREVADDLATQQPALLLLLPHQDVDPTLNMDFLEIGKGSQLLLNNVTKELPQLGALDPPPLVLLLGCRTATGTLAYRSFVSAFSGLGAPIVVGTLASVLGREAAPIAQQFVRDLGAVCANSSGEQDVSFGEVMRSVRRRMAAANNVAAFGLIAFGDSDWQLGGWA